MSVPRHEAAIVTMDARAYDGLDLGQDREGTRP